MTTLGYGPLRGGGVAVSSRIVPTHFQRGGGCRVGIGIGIGPCAYFEFEWEEDWDMD
jgi:hypothetical protein